MAVAAEPAIPCHGWHKAAAQVISVAEEPHSETELLSQVAAEAAVPPMAVQVAMAVPQMVGMEFRHQMPTTPAKADSVPRSLRVERAVLGTRSVGPSTERLVLLAQVDEAETQTSEMVGMALAVAVATTAVAVVEVAVTVVAAAAVQVGQTL